MKRYIMSESTLAIVALAALAAGALAQSAAPPPPNPPPLDEEKMKLELLIAQSLDQPTDLVVKEMPLRAALEQLGDSTGVPLDFELQTQTYLPYGRETRVDATIRGRPFREALEAMLRPLGLEFEVLPEMVVVKPTPGLRRIGRRATWEELETLEKLYAQPWSEELFAGLKFQFVDSSADDAEANRQIIARLAKSVGSGSAAEVLDHATHQYGWTWYPQDQHIVVLPNTRQVERQLRNTIVSVRYERISLQEALLDLARRANVTVRMDPNVLASLPPQTAQRFSLAIENASVLQVLEVVAGQTGLAYIIEGESIRLTNNLVPAPSGASTAQDAAMQAAISALRTNSLIGEISMPAEDGTRISFFIRENDLAPDVNELRKAKIRETSEKIRKLLAQESASN
jgi:hypothetical protein